MITLQNITKVYKTNSRRQVHALKDVSLSFPEKGLCLVAGKSGCGKTTLLNILGGLDRKFEGSYVFLDKQLNTDTDFADFRRDYVSFVFQDFNLIDDFTIAENLTIGFTFTDSDASNKVNEVLHKVGLADYGERYPSELSGGEQQRVAVARALLKDSKVLLADEPTGNLDPENAVEIYELLKQISADRLVVIVSHDENLGNKYCDYKVQLERGALVANNLPSVEDEPKQKYKQLNARTISNKVAFQLAKHEYAYKKGRSVATTVVLALCFVVMAFCLVAWQYSPGDVVYRLAKSQGHEYIHVSKSDNTGIRDGDYKRWLDGKTNNGVEVFPSYFSSREEAENYGVQLYDFEGTMNLAPNVFYLSDFSAEKLIKNRGEVYIDGQLVQLEPDVHTMQDLIGAYIDSIPISDYGLNYFPASICGGIYHRYAGSDSVEYYKYGYLDYCICHTSYARAGFYRFDVGSSGYAGPSYVSGGVTNRLRISDLAENVHAFVVTTEGEVKIYDAYDPNVLSDLGEKEIYVNSTGYAFLSGQTYSFDKMIEVVESDDGSYVYNAKVTPEALESVNLTMYGEGYNIKWQDIKVKGILFVGTIMEDYNRTLQYVGKQELKSEVYTNDKSFLSKCDHIFSYLSNWLKISSIPNFKQLCLDSYKNDSLPFRIESPYNVYQGTVDGMMLGMMFGSLAVGVVLVLVTLIILGLTISSQISGRAREIGIFKALGARNGEITRIYLFELLLMVVPICVGSILLTVLMTVIMNAVFHTIVPHQINVLYYNWYNAFIMIGAVSLVVFLAVIIPLTKIKRANVIEAIRNS